MFSPGDRVVVSQESCWQHLRGRTVTVIGSLNGPVQGDELTLVEDDLGRFPSGVFVASKHLAKATNGKTVYLAGPMRGHEDHNRAEFLKWEKRLKGLGYEVTVPHDLDVLLPEADWHGCMKRDFLEILTKADVVAVMPGYDTSDGAIREYLLAKTINMPILYLRDVSDTERAHGSPSWEATFGEAFTQPAPQLAAIDAITSVMREGRKKHPDSSWVWENPDEHLRKAARHILSHQLVRDGQAKQDGENHLHNSMCRLAMGIVTQEKDNGN